MQKRIKSIPKPAMDAVSNAPWLGHVRELENFIERAFILKQGDGLDVPLAETAIPTAEFGGQEMNSGIVLGLRS
ncbi:MAG TPA: hypothetical protein VFF50_09390 [Candidatus Deferrimicrobiaceae bacterium]|nr:hypothetical protein [Candidatus Deferrimicrobiaceae bacterium]